MRFFEFIFWLAYVCYGFLFPTFCLMLVAMHDMLKSKDGPGLRNFISYELSVGLYTLLFCSTLRWCIGTGPEKQRLYKLKISAFYLSLIMIFPWISYIIGASRGMEISMEFKQSMA